MMGYSRRLGGFIVFTPLIVAGLLFIIADKKAAKPKWFS